MSFSKVSQRTLGKVEALCNCIDPDVDFDQFIDIMDSVFIETQGTKAGLAILETWTRTGNSDELPSTELLRKWWNALDADAERSFGMGKLMHLAKQSKKKHKK
jgi:hypothetical protein